MSCREGERPAPLADAAPVGSSPAIGAPSASGAGRCPSRQTHGSDHTVGVAMVSLRPGNKGSRGEPSVVDAVAPEEAIVHEASRSHHGPPLGELLVDRGTISADLLTDALAKHSESGKLLGQVLIEHGLFDERQLLEVFSEQLHMPIVDLRNVDPELDARSPPNQIVQRGGRTAHAPLRRGPGGGDGGAAHARGAPQLEDRGGTTRQRCARAGRRRPHAHRPFVPRDGGDRRSVDAFQGDEARRRDAATRRPSPHDRRHAPVVQVVNRIITAGGARPCLRHPHRAPGRRSPRAVPCRRRAARRHHAAVRHGPGARESHQDHGRHEHRRTPPLAGRPVRGRRSTAAARRPGRHHRDDLGREGGAADPRQEPVAARARPPRDAARDAGRVLEAHPLPVRHGDLRRPDRQRQDHDALRGADRDQRLDATS